MINDDLKLIRYNLQRHREALQQYGLHVELTPGLTGWKQLIQGQHGVNPTLDPDANSEITEANSLWLQVLDIYGIPAGIIALRVFDGQQRVQFLIESGRYWWSMRNAFELDAEILELPEEIGEAEGRIAIMGGMYVWPGWRGLRLGWHLTRMVRLSALLLFDCDHVCGYVLQALHNASMPDYYGHARSAKVVEDFKLPDESMPMTIYVTHSTREEAIARLKEDATSLDRLLLPQSLDTDPQPTRATG